MHRLGLVNALAIRLPAATADQALTSLRNHPDVEGIFDDAVSRADGAICIDPAPPVPESYRWGLQKIDVPAAHQHRPGLGEQG